MSAPIIALRPDSAVVVGAVHLLDLLRVQAVKPAKISTPIDRDREIEPAPQEDVDDHCEDQAEQAHGQERPIRREITLVV